MREWLGDVDIRWRQTEVRGQPLDEPGLDLYGTGPALIDRLCGQRDPFRLRCFRRAPLRECLETALEELLLAGVAPDLAARRGWDAQQVHEKYGVRPDLVRGGDRGADRGNDLVSFGVGDL